MKEDIVFLRFKKNHFICEKKTAQWLYTNFTTISWQKHGWKVVVIFWFFALTNYQEETERKESHVWEKLWDEIKTIYDLICKKKTITMTTCNSQPLYGSNIGEKL